jgi:hypothetical protein
LPLVVAMAAGGAGILAPLLANLGARAGGLLTRLKSAGPALLALAAISYGVVEIAPLVYPVGAREYEYGTAPLRAARRMGLENAIVVIEPGRVPAHETNLAQNAPMNPNPKVLFLIVRNARDEACIRKNFPGRTWYRAQMDDSLVPY